MIKGVLDATHKGAWESVGGIPLVARNLYYLTEFNVKDIIILFSEEKKGDQLDRWKNKANITCIFVKNGLLDYLSQIKENFIYLNASCLFDKRIIEKILSLSPNTLLFENAFLKKKIIPIGIFNKQGIKIWKEEGINCLLKKSNFVYLHDINPFSKEIRGKVNPYVFYVEDQEDAKKATWVLIKNMQKKVMDLPAEYIDPFFENYLTYLLCKTWITPNMVTLFSLLVAIAIAILFYNGYLVIGAFCTYIVEILDGVDGKLARTKLQFSRFGKYECLVDYFYENLWYITIGMGLEKIYHYNSAPFFSIIMVICDTIDNIFYTLCDRWTGKNLDLISPFTMAFRKIAGRRNIYCFIFMIGFSLGYYFHTLMITSAWAFITVVIHAVVLFRYKK